MNAHALSIQTLIATRMKEVRKASGVSQRALGKSVGLDDKRAGPYISRYESGVHATDWETTLKIAQSLGVSVAYLVAETPELAELIRAVQHYEPEELRALAEEIRVRHAQIDPTAQDQP
ncbi:MULTISPECIES: helix-turn-helix domain-containing protein [Stenotrophomonas]|uniref:helix-turn-helix domain-containing protein n=1 Tax=Stenotrophomonas TaxID=40323 RepID=UPI0018D2BEBE|nr:MULTISPECIES: helix-turn-helix transcriptional regulator [Stenotrophomonas]MBH1524154.1 helix-turn-helix transcriptional regulator [Stenotrophomonas maltophilia]MBH1646692.1 helix-turn-helix transcriptional regulator [Stenotrophomonas maltophilia]MCO7474986.1 helix-turn-helix transcriptional regulator [Stenotrophomonas maltophilia]MDX5515865.1 helix-turn-helix transcriptional regulator [Stenotrophomonas sp. RG-453]UVH71532.1 helix-turn-helix transcriptional regulator [Stenotrophomonas malto